MKKIFASALLAAAALAFAGCAKHETSGPNDANRRYFDAWMEVNHPDVQPTGLGIYIIEDNPGTGSTVTDKGYVYLDYVTSNLSGKISVYTDAETARQLGEYDKTKYYGPKFMSTSEGSLPAGVAEALIGMKAGGHRRVIIPSWLMNYDVYDTEEEYLDPDDEDYNASSYSNSIYDLYVRDFTDDMESWQIARIGEYFEDHRDIYGNMTAADSIPKFKGMYYKQLQAPADTATFAKDTVIYINYTGRLLNGLVFDTSVEKTAKDNGIYSASRDYSPVQINWGETYTDITMGSNKSSVVSGFALTLWQMKAMEKGMGVFMSGYGYGATGSGSSIPAFAPLVFEIELVEKPED